jgi:RNA-binding protein 25
MILNITSTFVYSYLKINYLLFCFLLFRGTSLARHLKNREHEIEIDNRDRRYEKEEIEELRQKLLLQDNIPNIELEIKRRLEKEEEIIRRRLADLTRTTSDESDNDDETTNQNVPPKPVDTSKRNSLF